MSTLDKAMTGKRENIYDNVPDVVYANHDLQDNNNSQMHWKDERKRNEEGNQTRINSPSLTIPTISQISSKALPQINQLPKQEINTSKRNVSS